MKTIFSLILIVGILLFMNCGEQPTGEPHYIKNFFSFVTPEGADFFSSDERYSINQVIFISPNLDDIKLINGENVFETGIKSTENIIDFGNGDKDTLKMEWLPKVYGDGIGNTSRSEDLIKVTYYYNGVVIDVWDFKANPMLINELGERNVPSTPDWSNNPIIVRIPKIADEGELD